MKKQFTLREKIGQRFFVGFEGTQLSETLKELIKDYKTGNIILFRQNVQDKTQLKGLCEDIQEFVMKELGVPAFISIDQEGGMVTRLSLDCTNVPGAMAIAATGCKNYAREAGRITAKELMAMGVNFNLAPSLDINNNAQNPVIGVRSYGDTPQKVAEYGIEMIKGLEEEGILSCAKHFPGHGNTDVDSHLGLPKIELTYDELSQFELVPFKAAINAGVPAVMTAHIAFPKIEKENIPATFSKVIIQDILRGKLSFKGLIISDCMEMHAIRKHFGTPESIVKSLCAGMDIVFCSHTAELAQKAVELVEEAVQAGTLTERELDENLSRILQYKEKYLTAPQNTNFESLEIVGSEASEQKVREIVEKSFCLYGAEKSKTGFNLGANPAFISCEKYNATGATNVQADTLTFAQHMKLKFGGVAIINDANPTKKQIDEICESISASQNAATSVVFGTYQAHLNSGQIELAKALETLNVPMMCISLRNPYDLIYMPENAVRISAFEYTKQCLTALEKVISGEIVPSGTMPIML